MVCTEKNRLTSPCCSNLHMHCQDCHLSELNDCWIDDHDNNDNSPSTTCDGQTFWQWAVLITLTMNCKVCDLDQHHVNCCCFFAGVSIYSWSIPHLCSNWGGLGCRTTLWSPWAYANCTWSKSPCILSPDFGALSGRLQESKTCFSWRTACHFSLCWCDRPDY